MCFKFIIGSSFGVPISPVMKDKQGFRLVAVAPGTLTVILLSHRHLLHLALRWSYSFIKDHQLELSKRVNEELASIVQVLFCSDGDCELGTHHLSLEFSAYQNM